MNRPISYRIQLTILAGLMGIYMVLGAMWLPPGNRFLLVTGPLLVGGTWYVARRLGPTGRIGKQPIVVWLLSFLLLVMPVTLSSAVPRGPGFVIAWLGITCATGVWAVYRFPPEDRPASPRSFSRDLSSAVRWGVAFALVFSALSTCVLLATAVVHFIRGTVDPSLSLHSWATLVSFALAGGILGGTTVGLMRPLSRWPLGVMLIGVPVAALAYGTVGTALRLVDAEAASRPLVEHVSLAVGIGLVAGPLGGLIVKGLRMDDPFVG